MPIPVGQRLGPYEILSAIGAGGMGEVYRAKDTRLDRIIAIKVLPDHLASRAELRERFEREARTVASLNHPHICTLHDIGHQDGIDYLVMEYLEGETLAERLKKGPVPLDQVLQYAIEISDALVKAHRKGITHRDLKPSNIMLTKSGTKLLDFGLAKLKQETVPANISPSKLPTADVLTQQGTIAGTLQHMAPEQLEGKEADARTDIFAFGVLVYEMATGKKAFEGKSQASVISAIMSSDPVPMSSLQPMTPPALDRVVKKCLAKEPEKRWQDASDLTDELKWIAEGSSQAGLSTPNVIPARKSWRNALLWAGASLVACAITGLVIWNMKSSPLAPPALVGRSVFSLPSGQRFPVLDQQVVALSPDGKQLVYVASTGGTQQLYLRSMDSFEAKPIPGTEGATGPFFSPDSQWLGFFAEGKLKKGSMSGGATTTLCDVSTAEGATWGFDDKIVFATLAGGLLEVPAAGGTPQPLTTRDSKKGDASHRWPDFLPDAKAVLFNAAINNISWAEASLALYVPRTRERRDLIQGGMHPRYARTGHVLYAQRGNLMAAAFDPARLEVTSAPAPIVEGVAQSATTGAAEYSFSENGALVYIPGGIQAAQSRLVWIDRKGAEQPIAAPAHAYRFPRVSPDGKHVAVSINEELGSQIWIYDFGRDTLTRLTFEGSLNLLGAWSPDSKRVAFSSVSSGVSQVIFWQPADGSGKAERLTTNDQTQANAAPSSWSPDGQALAFTDINAATGYDLWVLHLSDRKAQLFLRTPSNESAPRFSPDGRWLAYVSDESGRWETYVQPYPGPGGKWQISTDGGTEPVWNPNGRELFYRSGDKMMAVEVTTEPSFSAGKPRMLFAAPYLPTPATFSNYDVSPDGQRFLMLKAGEQGQAVSQINVVQNWFEELKRRVPTGNK